MIDGADLAPEPPPGKQLGVFNYVIVFPMPSATTEQEEEQFRRQHLVSGCTYRDILMLMIEHAGVKANLDADLHVDSIDSLRSLRAAVIEMFHSLFETLFASHDGNPPRARTFTFASVDGDELFLCISPGDVVGEALAELGEYFLQLDEDSLTELGIKLSDSDLVPAYVKFHAEQKRRGLLKLHERPEAPGVFSVLRKVDRVRLMYDKMTDYLNLAGLQRYGLVNHSYPVHDTIVVQSLLESWGNLGLVMSLAQPIDEIRDYFGEKLAFYFLFMEHLGHWELGLLFLALPAALGKRALHGSDIADIPQLIYAFCLIIWCMLFAKAWRRKEAKYSNMWGMEFIDSDEIKDPINPRFQGKLFPSLLDENRLELQPDRAKKFFGGIVSLIVQGAFMCLIVTAVSMNQYYAAVYDSEGNTMAFQVAALLLSVQIKFFDSMWTQIATLLTDLEQQVTQLAYDQSKARKIFMMKFINTFYSFFYVAFFQELLDPQSCEPVGGCKALLSNNLFIVYITYIAFGIMDMTVPVAAFKARIWLEARELQRHGKEPVQLSLLEQQAKMNEYTGDESSADYLQIALPMYFFVLFSMVDPFLSVGLATVAVGTQLRADAWKLLAAYRRAFPDMSNGIGIWNDSIVFLEFLSIAVNVLLVLTQLDIIQLLSCIPSFQVQVRETPALGKALIFFVLVGFFSALRGILNAVIPDEPARVKLSRARQELQRMRMYETQTSEESQEHVELRAIGLDKASHAAEAARPLLPGDPMFEEAMV